MELSADQRRAVQRTGQDVCVVAGPGTGKTRVLAERFAWLVEQCAIDPARILAITFTEKAATEIKQRLIARFASRPALSDQIERAWVSTIHGFCARLLRENAIAAGLPPDFAVLDQVPADRLARDAAEKALDALFQEQPEPMRRLLESLDLSTQDDGRQPDLARSLLAVYESMRISGATSTDIARSAPDPSAEARELAQIALADCSRCNTEKQRIAHADLRDWAREFLDLPWDAISLEHFRLARLDVNLARLLNNSTARGAASRLKKEVLPRLEAWLVERWYAGQLALLRTAIERIHLLYREKKRADSALDFADLEEEAIRLLASSDDIRRQTSGRFDEVLMDELQDTNPLQWRLINLIRGKLFAVGDVNQSIFSFRQAEPAVFHEYREKLLAAGAEIDDLRENHRSSAEILEAVSRTLDGQAGIEPRPLTAARGSGASVERLVARGADAENVEAALVARRIRELIDSKECELSDIAVLVRALASVEPFERAFDRFDIPFLVAGGRRFLEAREIRDILALLAALVNPLDEIALTGVLRSPLAGIGDEDLYRIGPEGWRERFEQLFGRLRPLAGFAAPDLLLATALDECGYVEGLADRARANIEKFLTFLRREHATGPRPLAELLEDVEALRETQSEAEAPPSDAASAVRIMSIHAAKGLEFRVVFIAAMSRGPDRRTPVITFSAGSGIGAKWRNPLTGKGQSDSAHAVAKEQLKQREEAEENRLLYVAMTRARDRLILSYTERDRARGLAKTRRSRGAVDDRRGGRARLSSGARSYRRRRGTGDAARSSPARRPVRFDRRRHSRSRFPRVPAAILLVDYYDERMVRRTRRRWGHCHRARRTPDPCGRRIRRVRGTRRARRSIHQQRPWCSLEKGVANRTGIRFLAARRGRRAARPDRPVV